MDNNSVIHSVVPSKSNNKLIITTIIVFILLSSIASILFFVYKSNVKKSDQLAQDQPKITVEVDGPIFVKTDTNTGEKITVYQGKIVDIDRDARMIKLEKSGKTSEFTLSETTRLVKTNRAVDTNAAISITNPLAPAEILSDSELKIGAEIAYTTGSIVTVPSLTIIRD